MVKGNIWKAIDDRLGISRLAYNVPEYANNWPYMLGGMALACFVIIVVTGIFIAQFYNPSQGGAYNSVVYIATRAPFGGFARSLHYWAANLFILLILFHLIRVFISGSYKKPREFTWLSGLALFILSLGFYFTGTVLKQDQEAVEALTHNIGIGELLNSVGVWFTSGFAVNVSIVTRVFLAHTSILALLFLIVLAVHLYLIKLHGISPLPAPDAISRSTAGEGKSRFTLHLKRLAGAGLIIFALLSIVALTFPAPLGEPGVLGVEVAKPAWIFLPFYGMEDLFGFPAIVWGPAILFIILALIPFIDRNPYLAPRKRKPVIILGALILIALIGLGLEAHFRKIEMPATSFKTVPYYYSFVLPVAYAHAIPSIMISPEKVEAGAKLTVSADGMPESGKYDLSLEGETNSLPLGSTEIAKGEDSFDADFILPKTIAPGNYVIKAVSENDGRVFYSLSEFEIFSPSLVNQTEARPSAQNTPLKSSMASRQLALIWAVIAASALGGIILVRSKE